MADRLTLTRALEQGGIGRDAAEHIATEIFDAIHENVATKADVAAVSADLHATDTALRSEIAGLRADLSLVEHRLLTRLGSMIVAATGILIAIHYIH
jgi:hypothetical protein